MYDHYSKDFPPKNKRTLYLIRVISFLFVFQLFSPKRYAWILKGIYTQINMNIWNWITNIWWRTWRNLIGRNVNETYQFVPDQLTYYIYSLHMKSELRSIKLTTNQNYYIHLIITTTTINMNEPHQCTRSYCILNDILMGNLTKLISICLP